jgi:hypothetical protein
MACSREVAGISAMAGIVYLRQGERPPKNETCMVIECRKGRGRDEMGSGPSGSYARVGPEGVADAIALFRSQSHAGGNVYVRGVVSRASIDEAQFDLMRRRARRAARVPTIEDLEREEEISSAIADKLKSTWDALASIAANPSPNGTMLAEFHVRDYLSSAPGDEYAQRRALEILWKSKPRNETDRLEGWLTMYRAILPRLLAAWKRGA